VSIGIKASNSQIFVERQEASRVLRCPYTVSVSGRNHNQFLL